MPTIPDTTGSVIALDVGGRRVGVARSSLIARLPQPLKTLDRDEDLFKHLQAIIETEGADLIVVGLPRGLNGQDTAQTKATEVFIEELRQQINVPVHTQDEALTSVQAEAELNSKRDGYRKGEVDALAATYILEDFLNSRQSGDGATS